MSAILVVLVFIPFFSFSWNALPTSSRFSDWTSSTRSSTVFSMTRRQMVVSRVWPRR